jgi:hypothetical protein
VGTPRHANSVRKMKPSESAACRKSMSLKKAETNRKKTPER